MKSRLTRFNVIVANWLSDLISSMGLFWLCNLFILACLILDPPRTARDAANFISSNWFQLVALPVIGIASRIEVRRSNRMHLEEMKLLRQELSMITKICEGDR